MKALVLCLACLLALVVPSGAQSGSVAVVGNVAALTNRSPSAVSPVVSVSGYTTNGDWGPARTIRYVPGSTNSVDNGCTFATITGTGRWEAADCDGAEVNVRWFGATGNGSTADTTAITAAAGKVQRRGGGVLQFPPATYLVRSPSSGIVCYFSNLTDVAIDAKGAKFVTDDFGDSTFQSATMTVAGTTVTATTPTAHGWSVGDTVLVKNSSTNGYDGPYTVATVPATNRITFALSGYSTPTTSATALIRRQDFYNELFRFKSCTNINLGPITFRGTIQPQDIQYRLGWITVNLRQNCRTIRGDLYVSGVAYGFWSGDYDNPTTGNSSDVDARITAEDVGYPVSLWGSGHDSRFTIVGDRLHRGAYVGGVKRARFDFRIRHYDVAGILVTHQPEGGTNLLGCEDITADVVDTGTRNPIKLLGVGPTRYMATVAGYEGATGVAHKNIRIRFYATNAPATSPMQILTYGTNQAVEGLTIGGYVDERQLASTDVRHDFYVSQMATNNGTFRDLAIRDFTVLSPTNLGGYNATLQITNLDNDVVVDNYRSSQTRNFILPPGRAVASVPAFPNWRYTAFEEAQGQGLSAGVKLAATTVSVPLSAAPAAADLTLQWVGWIPSSGNVPLWCLTTNSGAVWPAGLGAQVTNGHLVVRLFGSSLTNWRALTVTNWQTDHGGKLVSLGVVRTSAGLRLWTDGHRNAAGESTAGSPPAWTNSIPGTNWIMGTETTNTYYSGSIYRAGAWNFDRSTEFPGFAVGWSAGLTSGGSSTNLIDASTANGSWETAGGGGSDVFAAWTESASGTSKITNSANAVGGSKSLAIVGDSLNSIAGVTSDATLEVGATYNLTFWARVTNSTGGGAINVVGPADGEYVVQLDSNWTLYSITKPWGESRITIKRSDLASRTAEIDLVTVRKVGALADFDWTEQPGDRVTGAYAAVTGGASTRIPTRGPGTAVRGDESATVRPGHDAPVQVFATALTTPRTLTLATDHVLSGDEFVVVRTASGASALTVGSRALASGQWTRQVYHGSAWIEAAFGYISLDVLDRANHAGSQSYTTITGLGSLATVNDAPSDGSQYARKNGAWAVITSAYTSTNFFTDLTNALIAGSNVTLAINTTNRTITISSTGGGAGATNGTAISVNGGPLLSFGNLTSTTGVGITATGTNITVALVDRDFGDITVSGSGTVFTVDNGSITTNKWDATAWNWVNGKAGLTNDQTFTGTNTFTKPTTFDTINVVTLVISNSVDVPSGGTGTNTHPAQALLVGNGTNAIRHLAAAASKLAGWNSAGVVTNVAFGVGVTNDDAGGLRVNFAAGANITFTTNGTQLTIAATAGGGSTNGTAVYIKGASASAANFVASAELDPTLTGTNVTFALVANSVGTNKIDSTFYNWINGKQSALTFSTGTTNSGGTITVALAPGSGVTFATNANTITISSTGSGSAVYVKGASVSSPNFIASPELDPTATGTNVTYAVVAGSIATNKIDSTFHGWVSGKQAALTFSTGTTNSGGTVTAALAAGSGVSFSTNGNTITITTTNGTSLPVTVSNVVSKVGAIEFELVIDGGGGAAPPNWTNYVQNVTASGVITNVYVLTATTNSGNWAGLTYFDIGVRLNAAMTGLGSTNIIVYNQRRTQQSPTNGVNRYIYTDAQLIYPELSTTNLPLLVWSQPASTYSLGTGSAGIHTWTNRVFIEVYQASDITFGAPATGLGYTNFTQFVVNTPTQWDGWKFDGSTWTNSPLDLFEETATWEYKDWDFIGANITAILEPGLIAMSISSGSYYVTNYAYSGAQAVGIKTAANDTVTTGNGFFWGGTGGSFSLGTNVHKARLRMFWPNTNAAATGFFGWGTTTSAEHAHALGFSFTNMLLCVQAVTNSTKAVGSTLQLYPLVDYVFEIRHTNTSARLQATSNGVAVYDYTFSSGIPIGFANLMWGGVFLKNQSVLATNAATLVVIDRMQTGIRIK